MSRRTERLHEAIAQTKVTQEMFESCSKEWALAHDAYNKAVTEAPRKGRRSGTDFHNLRMHAEGAYEHLLDIMRVHSDNLAHIAALQGKI